MEELCWGLWSGQGQIGLLSAPKKNAGDFHRPALRVSGVELSLAASAHGAEEDSGQAEEDG